MSTPDHLPQPPALDAPPNLDDAHPPLTAIYGGAFEQGVGLDLGAPLGTTIAPLGTTIAPLGADPAMGELGPGAPLAPSAPADPPARAALPPMDLALKGLPAPPPTQPPAWKENLGALALLFLAVVGPTGTALAVDLGAGAGPEGALIDVLLKSQDPIATLIIAGLMIYKFMRDDNGLKNGRAEAEARAVRAEAHAQRLQEALDHLPSREEVADLRARLVAADQTIARYEKAESDRLLAESQRNREEVAELRAKMAQLLPMTPTPSARGHDPHKADQAPHADPPPAKDAPR